MAKLYTKVVKYCADCPDGGMKHDEKGVFVDYWCHEKNRPIETKKIFYYGEIPKWCPLSS